jgi:integrase
MDFTSEFTDYFNEIRPDLSTQSKKLYGRQLSTISSFAKFKTYDPLKLAIRLVNKSLRNKNLDSVSLAGALQSQNQRLSAFRNLIDANKDSIGELKYKKITELVSSVGDKIRSQISKTAGENKKTADEEVNMVSWDDLVNFVNNYEDTSSNGLRNKLMLNLMINNFADGVGDGIKYHVILRVIEYASLNLWLGKRKPPDDGKNYIWLFPQRLYIQHSKTTGGVKRVGSTTINQPKVKIYPISKNVIDILIDYLKAFKIKNKEPIFYGNKGESQIDPNYFTLILTKLLTPLAPKINSTIIRKIYDNRTFGKDVNANVKNEIAALVDHSIGISENYYKKK